MGKLMNSLYFLTSSRSFSSEAYSWVSSCRGKEIREVKYVKFQPQNSPKSHGVQLLFTDPREILPNQLHRGKGRGRTGRGTQQQT